MKVFRSFCLIIVAAASLVPPNVHGESAVFPNAESDARSARSYAIDDTGGAADVDADYTADNLDRVRRGFVVFGNRAVTAAAEAGPTGGSVGSVGSYDSGSGSNDHGDHDDALELLPAPPAVLYSLAVHAGDGGGGQQRLLGHVLVREGEEVIDAVAGFSPDATRGWDGGDSGGGANDGGAGNAAAADVLTSAMRRRLADHLCGLAAAHGNRWLLCSRQRPKRRLLEFSVYDPATRGCEGTRHKTQRLPQSLFKSLVLGETLGSGIAREPVGFSALGAADVCSAVMPACLWCPIAGLAERQKPSRSTLRFMTQTTPVSSPPRLNGAGSCARTKETRVAFLSGTLLYLNALSVCFSVVVVVAGLRPAPDLRKAAKGPAPPDRRRICRVV